MKHYKCRKQNGLPHCGSSSHVSLGRHPRTGNICPVAAGHNQGVRARITGPRLCITAAAVRVVLVVVRTDPVYDHTQSTSWTDLSPPRHVAVSAFFVGLPALLCVFRAVAADGEGKSGVV